MVKLNEDRWKNLAEWIIISGELSGNDINSSGLVFKSQKDLESLRRALSSTEHLGIFDFWEAAEKVEEILKEFLEEASEK